MGLDFSLKSRKKNIVNNAFRYGAARYTHIRGGRNKSYFTRNDPLDSDNEYTASEICKMIGFLVDDTFVRFDIQLFPQTVGILVQTVPRHWLTCFSIPLVVSLLINSKRKAKESLLESSVCHIAILMTLPLLIKEDLESSFLIVTPNNSQFERTHSLIQLLLISTYFLIEMRTIT